MKTVKRADWAYHEEPILDEDITGRSDRDRVAPIQAVIGRMLERKRPAKALVVWSR